MINKYSDTFPNAYGVTINIYGTLNGVNDIYDQNGASIYLNGSIKHKTNYPVINIDGANLNSKDGAGIYAAGYGKWNIKNSTIKGSGFGIGTKSGLFDIINTTITADGEKAAGVYNSNGINVTGSAFQVESNNGYAGDIIINVEDSKFESKNGNAFYHYFASATEGESVTNSLLSFKTINSEYNGGMEFVDKDNVTIEGGKFTVDVSSHLKDTYSLTKKGNMYIVNNFETDVVNNEKLIIKVDGKEATDFIKPGSTVTLNVGLNEKTYIKEIKVTKINDENTTVTVSNDSFVMPEYGVRIIIKTEECSGKNGNIIELLSLPRVDSNVELDETTKKEMTREIENETGITALIDISKLEASEDDLIEIEYDITLTKYDMENNTLSFVIKPYYLVNHEEVGVVPNDAIKGKVKVNVPIPSSVKDTHVKVKHYDGEKLIEEKEYKVRIDKDGNKYVTIETDSFSRFELNFYTPVNNPSTGDNIVYYLIGLAISALSISAVVVVKKHF